MDFKAISEKPFAKGTKKKNKEFARFKITSSCLDDQIRMIIKQGRFSNLEILEIYLQINKETRQQDSNKVTEALNREKQNPPSKSTRQVIVIDTRHTQAQRKKRYHKKKGM